MLSKFTSALPQRVVMLLAGVSAFALAPSAFAQDAPAPAAAASDQGVEEIIVTGQRRSEKLQNVSIAETVLTSEQLQEKKITGVNDLQNAAPALTIGNGGLVNSVNIRGIGLASGSPNVANGVATYFDGLFQPPIVQAGSFFDIASIEVMRGPQGTLVGSNSTGGAILISSANPKFTGMSGYLQGQVGSFNQRGVEGAINLPLTDDLAARVAAISRSRDSYNTDLGPFNNNADSPQENAARVSVLWKRGAFQALAKIEAGKREVGGYAYRPIAGIPGVPTAPGGIYDYAYNTPTFLNDSYVSNNLELKYETESGIVFRSLTGYQDKRSHSLSDLDATTVVSATMDQRVRERQTSQEFNIISPTAGRFSWILGAYYQNNRILVDIFQAPVVYVWVNPDKTTTGIFGQFNYKLTDKLEVQLGLRQSTYEASGPATDGVYLFAPPLAPGSLMVAGLGGSESDSAPTGKLSFNYKPNKDNLVYAFVARGYKSGGFNGSQVFEPEFVWNYELGWKANFFDNHVKTQLDIFANDYTNFQADGFDTATGQGSVVNMPKSTINGVEGQVQVKAGGWSVDAGFAYVDSQLGEITLVNQQALPQIPGGTGPQCPVGTPSNPPVCFDYGPFLVQGGGGPNLYSPKWTYNISAAYEFVLADDKTLTPRINLSHQDESFANLLYARTAYLPPRDLVSGLLTLQTPNWTAEIYGTNLTEEDYVTGINATNQFYGAPREFGFRLRRDF